MFTFRIANFAMKYFGKPEICPNFDIDLPHDCANELPSLEQLYMACCATLQHLRNDALKNQGTDWLSWQQIMWQLNCNHRTPRHSAGSRLGFQEIMECEEAPLRLSAADCLLYRPIEYASDEDTVPTHWWSGHSSFLPLPCMIQEGIYADLLEETGPEK